MWTDPWIVLTALVLEAAFSYPLARLVPHPVTWLGAWIASMEHQWNRGYHPQRAFGAWTLALLLAATIAAGFVIQRLAGDGWVGAVAVAVIATVGLAQRSLYDHVADVLKALEAGDIVLARHEVAKIVGRDVQDLDEKGIAAAAIESLAESFNDGIVAPVFWFLVAGLPGLFAYKAVNTADSMIGHRDERYGKYGWAAARMDDVMNLIPARLAGLILTLVAWRGIGVLAKDASKHASPNAGWPEAAMAGALGVRLGGTVHYDEIRTERPWFGEGPPPTAHDLRRALRLYLATLGALWAFLALGGLAWPR